MTDTAQPIEAAETEVVSKEEAIASAADAFKVSLGQAPERPRAPNGQFAPLEPQIEAESEAEEVEEAAESHEEQEIEEEAAEQAQPEALDLPPSWPAEQAEAWQALPPETQAFIAEREGQREAAVNAKFQEAANARKVAETQVAEASTIRDTFVGLAETVLAQFQPTPMPPESMLDSYSNDYDPDTYHLLSRRHQQDAGFVQQLIQAGQQAAQLRADEDRKQAIARVQQINEATREPFLKNCPDAADQAKAPAVFQGLMEYAVSQGAPEDIFTTPTSAMEWNMLWKAREFDRLQEAKAKVQTDPKPEPKKASPAVRPGVATPPSARAAARNQAAKDRLARSGTIEDGAAVWKTFLK